MTILVFGYEPFLEYVENPSQIVARTLNGTRLAGHNVVGVVLPVEYGRVESKILQSIKAAEPSLVLGVGLAPGRGKITPEKVALNYKHSDEPDNAGVKKSGEFIDKTQPDAFFSNMPVERIVDDLTTKGIPAELSLSAGAYLCNFAMFIILREAKKQGFVGGFVHIPCHEELAAKLTKKNLPSMNIKTMIKAIEVIVEHSLRTAATPKEAKRTRKLVKNQLE